MQAFLQAIDVAFLYMHDKPSSITNYYVYGLPMKVVVELQGM